MPGPKLIGQDYITPDIVAKVTGQAKFAEDYRADGMLFAKLLLSPMPHGRVRSIDTRAALELPGVKAILTADDVPPLKAEGVSLKPEVALTNEPVYAGEPILAVAAVDEETAVEAIERIVVDFEPLPFCVDPVDSLRPDSANARLEGNVYIDNKVTTLKWTTQDFAEVAPGVLPWGRGGDTWQYGELEAGFKEAAVIVDETFVTQSTGHQPLETRTAMAYWQNGKLYMHCSTQSLARSVQSVADWVGIAPSQVVLISAYTGGGFGSKIPSAETTAIPALLARKTGQPVMMRISREEEQYIGRARAGWVGRARMGFRSDGRLTALDLLIVMDNGPYFRQGDFNSGGRIASLSYQPLAMRFRGLPVLTNTPPRRSQRSPGGMQINGTLEPLIYRAAKQLGLDQVTVRRINAPSGKAKLGPPEKDGSLAYVTSAFVPEALDRGAALFEWETRKARAGRQEIGIARGVGVCVGAYSAGTTGFDGLMIVKPDGRLQIHSGIGNLGTHSTFDAMRVAAQELGMPWDRVDVLFGDTGRGVPWSCTSSGSQTIHSMTRANYAAALDLKRKLQEIAARDLGGAPESYDVDGARVFRRGSPLSGLSFEQVARRAIQLGGKFDGHELPEDINAQTKTSASELAGQGLMGVAKDNFKRDGQSLSHVAGFAEVEVEVETGAWRIVNYTAVVDVGTVIHPRNLRGQTYGGSMLGIGHVVGQKWVYDKNYGLALAKRFHYNKPPTILDTPHEYRFEALDIPDPETPTGARGIGEPPVGAAYGAVINALLDALGEEAFRRTPVTPDLVLTALENRGKWAHEPLTSHV